MTVTLTDNNNQYPLANASQGAGACVSFALTPAEIFTTNPIAKSTAYFAVAVGAETGDFAEVFVKIWPPEKPMLSPTSCVGAGGFFHSFQTHYEYSHA